MKRFTGRHLFPDQNQIYRIRKTVLSIQDELSELYGRYINLSEFADIVNKKLISMGWLDEATLNESRLSRLSRFGKGSEANNIKLLETLPLLHVVTQRYNLEDLQRIALGQPLKRNEGTITLYVEQINEVKTRLLSALTYWDELTNVNAIQVSHNIDFTEEEKLFIFESILNYADNALTIREMGIINNNELIEYTKGNIPDLVIVSLLANCKLPGIVLVMLKKKQDTLQLDNHVSFDNVPLDELF